MSGSTCSVGLTAADKGRPEPMIQETSQKLEPQTLIDVNFVVL